MESAYDPPAPVAVTPPIVADVSVGFGKKHKVFLEFL